MPITAVLFDFGGVILDSPFQAFAEYESRHGLPADFLRTVNATNPDTNAWARLERNEIGLEEFAAAFEAEALALGQHVRAMDVLELLHGRVRPSMALAVERCAARLKTALLTNNILTMHADARPRDAAHLDVLQHFDAIIESSRVGVRKPDPRFYELACEALAIEPREAVFLDDLGVNLKPARAMGMTTIKVLDADQAITDLEAVVEFPLR